MPLVSLGEEGPLDEIGNVISTVVQLLLEYIDTADE